MILRSLNARFGHYCLSTCQASADGAIICDNMTSISLAVLTFARVSVARYPVTVAEQNQTASAN